MPNQADKKTPQDPAQTICSFCKAKGHKWRNCRKLMKDVLNIEISEEKKIPTSKDPVSFMAIQNSLDSFEDRSMWVADSGTTHHMTGRKEILANYEEFDVPRSILTANGNASALGQGTFTFIGHNQEIAQLEEVWYIPSLKTNLFSLESAMSKGFDVIFDSKDASIKLIREGEIYLYGKKNEGLMFFALTQAYTNPQDETSFLSATSEDWHRRFAHCGQESIKRVMNAKAVTGLTVVSKHKAVCEPCATAKVVRGAHKGRSTSLASRQCRILHIDTNGPQSTRSIGGNNYFVLSVEEYSSYKHIEFTNDKSNIKHLVKKIVNQVEAETKQRVYYLYTDNGSEFKNEELEVWLTAKGITHCFSAPYTPEQNGLVERAMRTIVEGTRTLLVSSGMNHTLWAQAASCVIYATNRLLATNSDDKTRFKLHFGWKPDVSNLRIFGQSAVIKENQRYKRSKWDGNPIVRFVGYTDRFNTYKFYSEKFNKTYMSADYKFLGQESKNQPMKVEDVIINITSDNESEELNDYEEINDSTYSASNYGEVEPNLYDPLNSADEHESPMDTSNTPPNTHNA